MNNFTLVQLYIKHNSPVFLLDLSYFNFISFISYKIFSLTYNSFNLLKIYFNINYRKNKDT